jgi:putative transposase
VNRGRVREPYARNLALEFADEQPFRFLIHDRDTKFGRAFDEVFRAEGITVIRTPGQAPNANAFAERWVRTVRADCLDRILILGRRHLVHVLRAYRHHYNEHRPHRALQLLPPNGRNPTPLTAPPDLRRRDLLGGLSHEYEAAEFANPTGRCRGVGCVNPVRPQIVARVASRLLGHAAARHIGLYR